MSNNYVMMCAYCSVNTTQGYDHDVGLMLGQRHRHLCNTMSQYNRGTCLKRILCPKRPPTTFSAAIARLKICKCFSDDFSTLVVIKNKNVKCFFFLQILVRHEHQRSYNATSSQRKGIAHPHLIPKRQATMCPRHTSLSGCQ